VNLIDEDRLENEVSPWDAGFGPKILGDRIPAAQVFQELAIPVKVFPEVILGNERTSGFFQIDCHGIYSNEGFVQPIPDRPGGQVSHAT
jgi:hypothetical protein